MMDNMTLIPVFNSLERDTALPKEIKLLPLGCVKSKKGDFLVDTESYESIYRNFKEHSVDIPIDYEHQTLQNVQAPAAGWIKDLIIRNDGVYGAVEWTERASQYLAAKEYRYLSPVVQVRESDRKALLLHSVALTNTPAIDGMTAIINSMKPAASEAAVPEALPDISSGSVVSQNPEEFISGLREILQLPAEADFSLIAQRITELMRGHAALKLEADTLRFEAHKQEAESAVYSALRSGKLIPPQKDWAFRFAMQGLESFKEWAAQAPQIVQMGEIDFGSELAVLEAHKDIISRNRSQELLGLSDDDVRQYSKR